MAAALLFGQGAAQGGGGLGRGAEQHLPGRADVQLFQIAVPPLAEHVEGGKGVYLVPPVLAPGGAFGLGGPDVHDAAPHAELARALHLAPPVVARVEQALLQLGQGQFQPGLQGQGVAAEFLFGHGVLQKGLGGHAHRPEALAHQIAQHCQPPVFIFPPGAHDGPQQKVPGREHRRRKAEGGKVRREAGGLRLPRRDRQQGAAALGGQQRQHLGAARRGQAEEGRRAGDGQVAFEFFVFRGAFEDVEHGVTFLKTAVLGHRAAPRRALPGGVRVFSMLLL